MTKYVEARIPGGLIQEVASVGPTDADNGYGPQQEANARLIAAAPELLAAAVRYLEFRHQIDVGFGDQFSGQHPETQLREAIAKATKSPD